MKIVKKKAENRVSPQLLWLALVTAALLVGLFLGNAGAVTLGQRSLSRVQGLLEGLGPAAPLPLLTGDVDFEAYNQLLQQLEESRRSGVLWAGDAPFVNGDMTLDGEATPVRLRLLPGLGSHLEDTDKWNLEIETRGNSSLAGLSHANLIDPEDNNFLAEWAFRESLRREGLLAGTYQFVNLVLNGAERGIYALQDAVWPTTLLPGGESPAAVVAYDAAPLLASIARYGDMDAAITDPVANLTGSDLRYFDIAGSQEALREDDDLLAREAGQAVALLRGLQSGQLLASQVFDVEKYGRFLALVDLWGASGALLPMNLRYAFNRASGRLEPVAHNGNALDDELRIPAAAMYQDRAVQESYARALEYVSSPDYLEELRADLGPEVARLQREFVDSGQGDDIWDELTARQQQLRQSLQPERPVIAQLGSPDLAQDAIIRVQIANTLNLPLVLHGFDIDGATFLEADPRWISAGADYVEADDGRLIIDPVPTGQDGLHFVAFDIPITAIIAQDDEIDFLNEIVIGVATSILGLEPVLTTNASPGVAPVATPSAP